MGEPHQTRRAGLLFGLGAYLLWGVMPLYFKAIASVPATEIVAHRILWSLVFLAALASLWKRWPAIRAAAGTSRVVMTLILTALLIDVNWLVYIYAVVSGHVLEGSLGYYLNPLFNVLLGVVLLKEKLSRAQVFATLLAGAGVAVLAAGAGSGLWISLTLAFSFGLYGFLRKIAPVDSLEGLSIETALLAPIAAGWLFWLAADGSIRYEPAPDFFGTDAFTYSVDDDLGGTAEARVLVTVRPVDDAPRFVATPVAIRPAAGAEVVVGGAPGGTPLAQDTPFLVEWQAAADPEGNTVTYRWQLAATEAFSPVLLELSSDAGVQAETSLGALAVLLADRGVAAGASATFYHRVLASDGQTTATGEAAALRLTRGTMTATTAPDDLPAAFALSQNYPNPFNPATTITYALNRTERVTLRIYDVQGPTEHPYRTVVALIALAVFGHGPLFAAIQIATACHVRIVVPRCNSFPIQAWL